MNQRLHNLSKWRYLPEGQSIAYAKPKRRTVLLEVNCPDEVAFYILQDEAAVRENPERVADEAAGRPVFPSKTDALPPGSVGIRDGLVAFLGVAKGRDRFEFAVDGAFELFCEGGSAYVYTADGQDISTHVLAPVVFTRIANRRQRNPQLELMQYQMRVNQERMLKQLDEEGQRRIAALEARIESYAEERRQGTPLAEPRKPPAARPAVDEAEPPDAVGDAPDPVPGSRKGKARKREPDEGEMDF